MVGNRRTVGMKAMRRAEKGEEYRYQHDDFYGQKNRDLPPQATPRRLCFHVPRPRKIIPASSARLAQRSRAMSGKILI
jgi:hypothetical protein